MVAAVDANHATPHVQAGRPNKLEDDFLVLKTAGSCISGAIERVREARQIPPAAAKTKLVEATEQASTARRALDEFLDGRRDVRGAETYSGRDLEANRVKLRGLYHQRRARGLCVKCEAPAVLDEEGKPQARCAHHTRVMTIQRIKRELAVEIDDATVPAVAALQMALDELGKLEVPAHAERIVGQLRAFVEAWGR